MIIDFFIWFILFNVVYKYILKIPISSCALFLPFTLRMFVCAKVIKMAEQKLEFGEVVFGFFTENAHRAMKRWANLAKNASAEKKVSYAESDASFLFSLLMEVGNACFPIDMKFSPDLIAECKYLSEELKRFSTDSPDSHKLHQTHIGKIFGVHMVKERSDDKLTALKMWLTLIYTNMAKLGQASGCLLVPVHHMLQHEYEPGKPVGVQDLVHKEDLEQNLDFILLCSMLRASIDIWVAVQSNILSTPLLEALASAKSDNRMKVLEGAKEALERFTISTQEEATANPSRRRARNAEPKGPVQVIEEDTNTIDNEMVANPFHSSAQTEADLSRRRAHDE